MMVEGCGLKVEGWLRAEDHILILGAGARLKGVEG